jgi:hypothetical protein
MGQIRQMGFLRRAYGSMMRELLVDDVDNLQQ